MKWINHFLHIGLSPTPPMINEGNQLTQLREEDRNEEAMALVTNRRHAWDHYQYRMIRRAQRIAWTGWLSTLCAIAALLTGQSGPWLVAMVVTAVLAGICGLIIWRLHFQRVKLWTDLSIVIESIRLDGCKHDGTLSKEEAAEQLLAYEPTKLPVLPGFFG